MFNRSISPLVIVFLILGALILIFKNKLQQSGFDWQLLSAGNLIIYIITIFSLQLLTKGMQAENTHQFMRNAYSGILLKLFACAAAAFIYILIYRNSLNKPGLLTCLGFYLVYTFVELKVVMKQSKQKKNVKG